MNAALLLFYPGRQRGAGVELGYVPACAGVAFNGEGDIGFRNRVNSVYVGDEVAQPGAAFNHGVAIRVDGKDLLGGKGASSNKHQHIADAGVRA